MVRRSRFGSRVAPVCRDAAPTIILTHPSPLLRRVAVQITEFGTDDLLTFAQELGDTMMRANGAGLAATQVDRDPCVAMFALRRRPDAWSAVCNPEIVSQGRYVMWREGCLSYPGAWENLAAPSTVTLRGMTPSGDPFGVELSGEQARAAWHESEHLRGALIVDRMSRLKRKMFLKEVKRDRSGWPAD